MQIIGMAYSIRYQRNGCIGIESCRLASWSVPNALGISIPSKFVQSAICAVSAPQHFSIQSDGKAGMIGGKETKRNVFEKEISEGEAEMAKIAVMGCPAGNIRLAQDGRIVHCGKRKD